MILMSGLGFGLDFGFWYGAWSGHARRIFALTLLSVAFPASQTNYGHDLTWALRGKAAPTAGQAISICVINEMCARSRSLAPNAKELRKAFP